MTQVTVCVRVRCFSRVAYDMLSLQSHGCKKYRWRSRFVRREIAKCLAGYLPPRMSAYNSSALTSITLDGVPA
jgi:hypothetical protein